MKQNLTNSIKYLPIDSLHPYARNARTHSGEQIDRIAASIQEFGFLNPILIDSASKTIIAGHGRLLAAQRLGLDKVPTVAFAHLTDTQRRAYTLADNKLALEAGWDEELLKIELDELRLEDFELDVIGFDDTKLSSDDQMDNEINGNKKDASTDTDGSNNPYSQKTGTIQYRPAKEIKPELCELYNKEKSLQLIAQIESESKSLPQGEKDFLIAAAYRHIVFNYKNIAEYYCHSDKDVQELMENSALVIIDIKHAIRDGYIKLSQALNEIYEEDNSEENEEEDAY